MRYFANIKNYTPELRAVLLIAWMIMIFPILAVYAEGWFTSEFKRYHVYDYFDSSVEQSYLDSKFLEVLNYLRPLNQNELDAQFFSTEDILHMQDVRSIYRSITIFEILLLIAILAITIVKVPKQISNRVSWTIIISGLVSISLLVIWGLFDFPSLFIFFHRVFFSSNDYWNLDPRTSNLIKFLPRAMFYKLFLGWITWSLLSVILFVLYTHRRPGKEEVTKSSES